MTDAEFRRRVIEAMEADVSDDEAAEYGAQCADDLGRVYADRVWSIILEAESD